MKSNWRMYKYLLIKQCTMIMYINDNINLLMKFEISLFNDWYIIQITKYKEII